MFLWWFCTSLAGRDEVDGLSPAASWDAKNDEILTIFKINVKLIIISIIIDFEWTVEDFSTIFFCPGASVEGVLGNIATCALRRYGLTCSFAENWNLEVFLRSRICNFHQISVMRMHKFQFTSLACTS